jgi:threonine dehydratase
MPASLTLSDIREARERLGDQVVFTPCTRSMGLDDLVACSLWLKFETRQRTGSFKDRGALNKLLDLSEEERSQGIVTASAGNHAQAVAYHATRLGIPATIVMPVGTPLVKSANTRGFGARVILHGDTVSDSLAEALRMVDQEGLTMVHPYDDLAVVAGQGTIGLELLEQVPDLTHVVVPIGGGGIISGIAVAAKALNPSLRIIGVEAAAAPAAYRSREMGKVTPIESTETIADGIAVQRIGDLTFPLIEEYVDDIVIVEEEEIASAILLLLERERTVVEGAGATPVAALVSGRIPLGKDDVVAAVLCGGNIDVNMIARIIERGLVADGRMARLMVTVRDRPGTLAELTKIVGDLGANVLEIRHRRAFADITVGDVEVVMHVETRGKDHLREIVDALEASGHSVGHA